MFAHAVDDIESSRLPHSARRLCSYCEGVHKGLRVVLSDIDEEDVDVPPDVVARRLDTGDNLE